MASLVSDGGPEARDALWVHPDLLPDAEDLDAPTTFVARREERGRQDAEIDAALADLLDGGDGSGSAGTGSTDGGSPGAPPA
jgi:hypothetical protein